MFIMVNRLNQPKMIWLVVLTLTILKNDGVRQWEG